MIEISSECRTSRSGCRERADLSETLSFDKREGIYLAGCCQEPKDVPDTVAQGKAAASSAIVVLSKMKQRQDL